MTVHSHTKSVVSHIANGSVGFCVPHVAEIKALMGGQKLVSIY
jgi:hypothetical protein